jgi:hypothetical protein
VNVIIFDGRMMTEIQPLTKHRLDVDETGE